MSYIKTKKKKPYNQFLTVVIKTAKVGKVKCFCKAVKSNTKDVFGDRKYEGLYYNNNGFNVTQSYYCAERYNSDTVYYYEVGANDGSYRKCATKNEALKLFAMLIEFENRQMQIE